MLGEAVATNRFLDDRTAADIDRPITRLLRELDWPEPPLRLDLVRELLHLDRQYYSSTDDSVLRETIHRLRVGTQQVIRRPGLLLDVVRKRKLRALWVPDRRRILIDEELPPAKHRWGEAHEIGHSIIPWHEALAHGDERRTLSLTCEAQIEAEANYAAGRLLFLQDVFVDRVRSSALTFARVKELAAEYKNTMTSTLWRAVEAMDAPTFGLVSQHPRADLVDSGESLMKYWVRSRSFAHLFPRVAAGDVYFSLREFCWGKRGPVGHGEMTLVDIASTPWVFEVECFYNGHEALTLGVVPAGVVT